MENVNLPYIIEKNNLITQCLYNEMVYKKHD